MKSVLVLVGLALISPSFPVHAAPLYLAQQPSPTSFNVEQQVAIEGTDPVAYFRQGQPLAGREEFAFEWMNARWLFASAENRDLFRGDPERYAPQFGGFCAYAVSQGYTAPIDPKAWSIVDGKLYLNLSQNVQRLWEQNRDNHISQAQKNWPGIQAGLLKP